MNEYTAYEQAYKNGFEAGKLSAVSHAEVASRVKVAYEQLSKCNTQLCSTTFRNTDCSLVDAFSDLLLKLIDVQAKLGIFKEKTDI